MNGAPLPRKEYQKHLESLQGTCAFCATSDDLMLKKFAHWTLMYSRYPYRKYHTLLVVKRHIEKFSELFPDELIELANVAGHIEHMYMESTIVSEESEYGNQLLFSWRMRFNEGDKSSVQHLHLHIVPKFDSAEDVKIEDDAWDIDVEKLTGFV